MRFSEEETVRLENIRAYTFFSQRSERFSDREFSEILVTFSVKNVLRLKKKKSFATYATLNPTCPMSRGESIIAVAHHSKKRRTIVVDSRAISIRSIDRGELIGKLSQRIGGRGNWARRTIPGIVRSLCADRSDRVSDSRAIPVRPAPILSDLVGSIHRDVARFARVVHLTPA